MGSFLKPNDDLYDVCWPWEGGNPLRLIITLFLQYLLALELDGLHCTLKPFHENTLYLHLHTNMSLNMVIICLFQYTTYEDCVKEAYMAAAKCRVSRLPLLTFNIYKVCDGYQEKLKRLCSAHCAKGQLKPVIHMSQMSRVLA